MSNFKENSKFFTPRVMRKNLRIVQIKFFPLVGCTGKKAIWRSV